jgi:anti-sigma regulatory factor (Ser/Thr protein kinase)
LPTTQSLTLPAKAESLGAITRFVREGAREANLPEARMDEVDLLVEEIFMNIARHSYPKGSHGEVTVMYSLPGPGELVVEFGDQGVEFNPLGVSPPDLTSDLAQRRVGGLGVFLLKEFADSLSYRREQGWNRLTFGISAKP